MVIHQFRLQFNAEEDRIVFLLNTTAKEEFRFWLTRRFTRLLWPVLQKLLQSDYKRREPDHSDHAGDMLAFEQERVMSGTNIKEKYSEEAKTYPLGENMILLTRIQVKKGPNGDILCLLPSQGNGIEVPVNPRFLHPFCKLLQDIVARAQWDIMLQPIHQPQSVQPVSKTIH